MVIANAMPFKLNFQASAEFNLPDHHTVRISGLDARAFLQAQCMNDVNALGDGQWQYNGLLNAQGRVMALFYLLRMDSDQFCMVLPALEPNLLLADLQRTVFRSKVRIELDTDCAINAAWQNSDPNTAHSRQIHIGETHTSLHPWGANGRRVLWLSVRAAETNDALQAQWHAEDMACGWPWLDATLRGLWTPQMLSLQRLEAFSLNKGCYPGQEIVARTHYLGKSKRGLFAVSGQGLQALQSVKQAEIEIGKVVNASADGDFGIAVLPLEYDESITVSVDSKRISVSTLELC